MAIVGQVREFVDVKEDIAGTIERVELYFSASYVKNDHRVPAFLAAIGADSHSSPQFSGTWTTKR